MKKTILTGIVLCLVFAGLVQAQETTQTYNAPAVVKPNSIRGGFYFQLGASLPNGNFAKNQIVPVTNPHAGVPTLTHLAGKIGPALDMGFLIYIGPAFAANHLRAGIDATFLTFSFNSTKPLDKEKKYEHYYYFAGQKFGPMITVNPIDKLMIDLSYKLNANVFYHFDEWHSLTNDCYSKYGVDLTQNEVSFGIRYLIMKFALQYNWGTIKINNFDNDRPYQIIDVNTLRILVGLKF